MSIFGKIKDAIFGRRRRCIASETSGYGRAGGECADLAGRRRGRADEARRAK
jgi:hypothetical protein